MEAASAAAAPEPFRLWPAIEARYPAREFAVLREVAVGAGFQARPRYADAIVVGLWPSRGHEVIGLEVKSDRRDWLRELKNPAKAEEGWFRFCDLWFVVEEKKDIVKVEELPKGWGLLSPRGAGLAAKQRAEAREPQPLGMTQVAALLKRAAEFQRTDVETAAALAKEYRRGAEDRRDHLAHELRGATELKDRLLHSVQKFEREAGISLLSWHSGEQFKRFIEIVSRTDCAEEIQKLLNWLEQAANGLRIFQGQLGDSHGAAAPEPPEGAAS